MQGRRVEYHPRWYKDFKPGDYGFDGKEWVCMTPNGMLGCLGNHVVTEHEDRTITVSPSILVTDGAGGHKYHGWLNRGVWSNAE